MKLVDKNPDLELGFIAKDILDKANAKGKKIKENGGKGLIIKNRDRIELEVLKDTRYYRKGQKINPHSLIAEELIANKIAKRID